MSASKIDDDHPTLEKESKRREDEFIRRLQGDDSFNPVEKSVHAEGVWSGRLPQCR
jgi:hypothetical protein